MTKLWNILWLAWVAMTTVNALVYGNGDPYAEFDVQCADDGIYVLFNKTKLDARTVSSFSNRDYKIYFENQESDPACIVFSNTTNNGNPPGITSIFTDPVWIKGPLHQCGIRESYDINNIIYSQTVVVKFGANPRPDIRREEYDYYDVNCHRNRTAYVKPDGEYYTVERTVIERQANNQTASFALSLGHADMSGVPQTSYVLGDYIQFTLALNSISSISSVIQECYSTNNGSKHTSLIMIRNRCPVNNATEILSFNSNTTVFKTQAYRGLGLSPNAVYLTCIVRICPASNQEAECQPCNSTTPTLSRKRRETEAHGKMEIITSTGFFIIDDGNQPGTNPVTTINPNVNTGEQQEDLKFIEGTGGTILIVVLSIIFVGVLVILVKVFVAPAVATATGIPPKTFKNQMETMY